MDLALMVAGTKYRGQFEERIKAVMDEIKRSENVMIFIDELHTLVGAGGAEGAIDASNILKPALSRGEIQCIGATTLDEYRKHIEKDAALERRFQTIMVEPPSVDETVEIDTVYIPLSPVKRLKVPMFAPKSNTVFGLSLSKNPATICCLC